MFLALFDQKNRRVFRGERGETSSAGHKWGGATTYTGLQPNPDHPPFHLLFRLNLNDPQIPVELKPSLSWLPLLCGIRYGACDLGYQVISDTEVKVLTVSEDPWDDFPYKNYPDKLPVEDVTVYQYAYDSANADDVLFYGGIFGFDHLTPLQLSSVEKAVIAKGLYDPEVDDEDVHEFIRDVGFPYLQGSPDDVCPDPQCENHQRIASLRTFAIFSEADDRLQALWGQGGEDLQIIYQICPLCQTIRTTNECG